MPAKTAGLELQLAGSSSADLSSCPVGEGLVMA